MRLGILGGTFDPPHIGHLILAEYALDAVQLDRVLFVPAADPPHKYGTRVAVEHRLAMIKRVHGGSPGIWCVARGY